LPSSDLSEDDAESRAVHLAESGSPAAGPLVSVRADEVAQAWRLVVPTNESAAGH
jgi:hypothetical protein